MGKRLALAISAVALAGVASVAEAATVLSLDAASACGKGGCFNNASTSFQKAFTGPVSLAGLSIDKAMLGQYANYAIKISFTTKDGVEVGNWGAFTLAALAGDAVTIGGQSVDWTGDAGDLVLNIEVILPKKGNGAGGGGFGGFVGAANEFASGRGTTTGGIVIGGSPLPGGEDPNVPAAVPGPHASGAPEPGAWALMLGGFFSSGMVLRGRRRFQHG